MKVLVTGAAGFIGCLWEACWSVAIEVVGVDDLNPYYDVRLKQARAARLGRHSPSASWTSPTPRRFSPGGRGGGHAACRGPGGGALLAGKPVRLCASNLTGHLSILELARHSKA